MREDVNLRLSLALECHSEQVRFSLDSGNTELPYNAISTLLYSNSVKVPESEAEHTVSIPR